MICPHCGRRTTNAAVDCSFCGRALRPGSWGKLGCLAIIAIILFVAGYAIISTDVSEYLPSDWVEAARDIFGQKKKTKVALGKKESYPRPASRTKPNLTPAIPDKPDSALVRPVEPKADPLEETIRLETLAINSLRLSDEDLAESYNERGLAYLKKGELDKAISDYNQAIEIKPNYTFAIISRAEAHMRKGQESQAIDDYTQAIKLRNNYAPAYWGRSLALEKAGRLSEAVEDIKKFLELQPGDAKGMERLKNLLAKSPSA
ncbi:MAG: tetratricopeptide repeat protein [Pseudomonadota bacterium]